VDRANPPFPRSAGEWWFGCGSAKKGNLVLAPMRAQDIPGAFDSADGADTLRDSSREELSSEKGVEITNIELDHSGGHRHTGDRTMAVAMGTESKEFRPMRHLSKR